MKYKVELYKDDEFQGEIIYLKTKKLKTFRKYERAVEWCKSLKKMLNDDCKLIINEIKQ